MSIPNPSPPVNIQIDSEVLIVDASLPFGAFDTRELWRYRELIWIFAARDIKVRYRQTIIGIAWTVLQPLAQMYAFVGLLRILSSEPIQHTNPEVTIFGSLLLYQLFSGILAASTLCLVENRQMVTKVYFPRIVLPLSACLRPLLDFGIGLVVLGILMLWFRVLPSTAIVAAPMVVLLVVVSGFAFGLWLSALNAHYRDFGYVVPFMLQLGLVASPVLYASSQVPRKWQWGYFLNPMSALLDGFRWSLLGTGFPAWDEVLISLVSLLFLLASGAWYFRRVEGFLADNI